MRFDLEFPIEWCGSLVRAVVVRPPTVDDIETAAPGFIASGAPYPHDPADAALRLLAVITDLPMELIDELDILDFEALCREVMMAGAEVVKRERARAHE